jgi:hypothetical protein
MNSISFSQLNAERRILLLIGVVLVVMLAMLIASPLRLNQDAALYMMIGEMVLDGQVPYIDYFENNFPLVHYLHVIPVVIGRALKINPIIVFQFGLFVLTVAAIALMYFLFVRYGQPEDRVMAASGGLGLALATLYLLYTNDYGQREHLFLVLFLPGFMLRWLRWNGAKPDRWLSFTIGLIAAVGAAIKPHFLVVPFALEMYWVIRHRTLRPLLTPEVVGFVLFGAAYASFFLLIPRAMLNGFIVMLQSLQVGYDVYGKTPFLTLIRSKADYIGLAAATLVAGTNRALPRVWNFLQSLAVLMLGGIVAFALQEKGWFYHLIPAVIPAIILVSVAVVCLGPLSQWFWLL